MRFPLRAKFFVFATLIATAPLALVGQNLARVARDELKSAANEDLTNVAAQIAGEFDTAVQGQWLTPLLVIRNGIDSEALGVEQKVSLLTLGLAQIPGVVALQLSIAGSDLPILVTDKDFSARLSAERLDPIETLRTPVDAIEAIRRDGRYGELLPRQIKTTGDWLATLALPLKVELAGRPVTFSAEIDLSTLRTMVEAHPFARRGEVDGGGCDRPDRARSQAGGSDRPGDRQRRGAADHRERPAAGDRGLRAAGRRGDARAPMPFPMPSPGR